MELALLVVLGVFSVSLVIAVVYVVRSFVKPRKETVERQPETAKQPEMEMEQQRRERLTLPKWALKHIKQRTIPILVIASLCIVFSGLWLWSESNRAQGVNKLQQQIDELSKDANEVARRTKDLEREVGIGTRSLFFGDSLVRRVDSLEREVGRTTSIARRTQVPRMSIPDDPNSLNNRVKDLENAVGPSSFFPDLDSRVRVLDSRVRVLEEKLKYTPDTQVQERQLQGIQEQQTELLRQQQKTKYLLQAQMYEEMAKNADAQADALLRAPSMSELEAGNKYYQILAYRNQASAYRKQADEYRRQANY